jgi:hypothetical protein
MKIEPRQWLGLKFQSLDGHDLAIPVNIDQAPLPLGRPLEDYFAGRVPMDAIPAVWPDPLFAADRILDLWPPKKPNQESVGAGEQSKAARNETTADRNSRWYDDFEVRRRAGNYRTYELIFDAMSIDEFEHSGVAPTIKKAVNAIRSAKGETGRRKISHRRL